MSKKRSMPTKGPANAPLVQGRSQPRGPCPPPIDLGQKQGFGNYDKYLPLRDFFLARLLISGLAKEKHYNTLLFALARVMMASERSGDASNFQKKISVSISFCLSYGYALLKFDRFCSCKSFSKAKC